MPNDTPHELPEDDKSLVEIIEALKDKPDHTQVETTWGHFKKLIATAHQQGAEAERQNLRIAIKQIVGMNTVFLLPSQTERCEGFHKNGLYKAIGIDVTKEIEEALTERETE